jgi:hypothetical protein
MLAAPWGQVQVLKRLWEHREPIGKVGVGGVYRTAEAAPKVVDRPLGQCLPR